VKRTTYDVLSVGVDWLTVTATEQPDRDLLVHDGLRLIQLERDRGNQRRPTRFRDCLGYTAGSVSVWCGSRLAVAQLTSDAAREHWPSLLTGTRNCSRVDLQVTVSGVPLDRHLAREGWSHLERHNGKTGHPRHYSLYDTRPTGQTLYVGAPTSDRRLRLYDKHAESRGVYPAGSWRYECQARGGLAGVLASDLVVAGVAEPAISGYVYQCFRRSGINPCWRPGGGTLRDLVPRTRTDAQRTLRWLGTQVRPALRRLALDGYGDQARGALGSLADLG
jgi:hypothetical protein